MRRYASKFEQMTDRYMSERVKDIYDIEKRLLRALIGQKREDLAHLTRPVVVIAHDLLPSQTAALDRKHVVGFATDVGGRTSHTAIVARALSIPAVVGLGNLTGRGQRRRHRHHRRHPRRGDRQPRRRATGRVPRGRQEDRRRPGRSSSKIRHEPAVTQDGHEVSLQANIEVPDRHRRGPGQGRRRASACTAPSSST